MSLSWIKNNCCALSKYISQSVQEEFYTFHSPELGNPFSSKAFSFLEQFETIQKILAYRPFEEFSISFIFLIYTVNVYLNNVNF